MSGHKPFELFVTTFGLKVPIVQAPTGSIAGPELAAAVTNAGGMGAMALTWAAPDIAAEHVRSVRAQTAGPFLVNFALAFPPHGLAAALEAGAPVVTFSWGDASTHVPLVRSSGARLGIQVTSAAGARRALECAPDFLICQGIEAGGHVQATRSLQTVLSEVLAEAIGIPVVAAGGIGDGAGIAQVLQAGAAAAMLGTRFVASRESRAHPEYKRRLVGAESKDAVLTVCFDGGWPYAAHRVLRNSTLETWEAAGCPASGVRPGDGETVAMTASGEPILRYEDTAPRQGHHGDIEAMCAYAGTSCGVVHDVPAAGELVSRLWQECQWALNGAQIMS